MPSWIVCQLGAREHYAVPAALHAQGRLGKLYTDAWLAPGSLCSRTAGRLLPRLQERYAPSLAGAQVADFTASLVAFELRGRLAGHADAWAHMLARNEWFQDKVTAGLARELAHRSDAVVFSYSYAGKRILELARERGCMTLLGQIDPGPVEEDLVAAEVARHPELKPDWTRVPPEYWDSWRKECRSADRIIVNSEWSRQALTQAGVSAERLVVVPLMYDSIADHAGRPRQYPDRFDEARPLRVLFLGSLIIRKGIAAALEAARLLEAEPVEFWFVGSEGVSLPDDLRRNPHVHWVGPVRRGETSRFYSGSDLFLFPTLSDGFGLTQLEAMSHGLPVIASSRCGEVVKDGEHGMVLQEPTAEHIAAAVRSCLVDPWKLTQWSANALKRSGDFGAAAVMPRLLSVTE